MKRLLVISAAAMLSGCAWHGVVERGTISTSAIDFSKPHTVDRSKKVEGTDRAHGVWLIPLGSPDADAAIKQTIANANKECRVKGRKVVALTDVEIKFRLLWLYLYSQRWYTVEAYPIYE